MSVLSQGDRRVRFQFGRLRLRNHLSCLWGSVSKSKYLKLSLMMSVVLLSTQGVASPATANPSAPEIYEFSITPSTIDLSSGDQLVQIRIGVRDSDGILRSEGTCEPKLDLSPKKNS